MENLKFCQLGWEMGALTPLRSLIKIDEEEYDFITAWGK